MTRVLAYLASVVLISASMGQAAPKLAESAALHAGIAGLQQDASVMSAQGFAYDAVAQIAELYGVKPAPRPKALAEVTLPSGDAAKVAAGDTQIALTQLSISEGTNNQLRVQQAQHSSKAGIFISAGVINLQDLATTAQEQGIAGIAMADGVVTLSRPLVIWQGATLLIHPGDVLQMQAAEGAFLLNFGKLDLRGATLRSDVAADAPETRYRPFVLTSGSGQVYAEANQFQALGMAELGPFAGFVISTQGLFASTTPSVLRGNRFEDIGGVALIGTKAAQVTQNAFLASRGGALILAQVGAGAALGNTIYNTKAGAGLRVTARSKDTLIAGNLVLGGQGNGVQVDGGSFGITLRGNAVLDNAQSGLAAKTASCLSVKDNVIAANGAVGLRLTKTGYVQVAGNALVGNAGSAIAVGAQLTKARMELNSNLMAQNQIGLTGAALHLVTLRDNDLSAQLPRIFDGEFAQYQAAFLTSGRTDHAAVFQISSVAAEDADFASICSQE
ncbi:right-handed parallel beta-helix repeat-containing protein [Cypionkella sp.]|uniref:right-handed parallel beta-helix repeat-containing protein n=1 Tax=Cypionkella sp. TaxID=2811411 RepID=UPI002728080F|nr:right-handed parallel beta-helix repeat-containing protein [Cypionkella sp.]MDO8982481.1 right-handed parallel beta-helix repeat-containing protein [Cypionkella sp.]MDP2050484.1 right-handed parallel beta-helix repeat-containing protein [Cypionkella sp.]